MKAKDLVDVVCLRLLGGGALTAVALYLFTDGSQILASLFLLAPPLCAFLLFRALFSLLPPLRNLEAPSFAFNLVISCAYALCCLCVALMVFLPSYLVVLRYPAMSAGGAWISPLAVVLCALFGCAFLSLPARKVRTSHEIQKR